MRHPGTRCARALLTQLLGRAFLRIPSTAGTCTWYRRAKGACGRCCLALLDQLLLLGGAGCVFKQGLISLRRLRLSTESCLSTICGCPDWGLVERCP
eukprot:5408018-Prymnesium_polylepis.1